MALIVRLPPQGENDLCKAWSELADRGIELAVCIASAIKRGVINAEEQARYEKTSPTLAPGFELVGLGQLIAGIQTLDQVRPIAVEGDTLRLALFGVDDADSLIRLMASQTELQWTNTDPDADGGLLLSWQG